MVKFLCKTYASSFSEDFDSVHGKVYLQQAAGHFTKIKVHHCALDSFYIKLLVSELTKHQWNPSDQLSE